MLELQILYSQAVLQRTIVDFLEFLEDSHAEFGMFFVQKGCLYMQVLSREVVFVSFILLVQGLLLSSYLPISMYSL